MYRCVLTFYIRNKSRRYTNQSLTPGLTVRNCIINMTCTEKFNLNGRRGTVERVLTGGRFFFSKGRDGSSPTKRGGDETLNNGIPLSYSRTW